MRPTLEEHFRHLIDGGAKTDLAAFQGVMSLLTSLAGFRIKGGACYPDLYGASSAFCFAETGSEKTRAKNNYLQPIHHEQEQKRLAQFYWDDENQDMVDVHRRKLKKALDQDSITAIRREMGDLLKQRPFDFLGNSLCPGRATPQGLIKRAFKGSKTITIFSDEPGALLEPLGLANYGGKKGIVKTDRSVLTSCMLGGSTESLTRNDENKLVPETFMRLGVIGLLQPDRAEDIFMNTAWTTHDDGFIERFFLYHETKRDNSEEFREQSQTLLFSYYDVIARMLRTLEEVHKLSVMTARGTVNPMAKYWEGPIIEFESAELRKEFFRICAYMKLKKKATHVARAHEKMAQILIHQALYDSIADYNYDALNLKITERQLNFAKYFVYKFGRYEDVKDLVDWEYLSRYSRKNNLYWYKPKAYQDVGPNDPGDDDDPDDFNPGGKRYTPLVTEETLREYEEKLNNGEDVSFLDPEELYKDYKGTDLLDGLEALNAMLENEDDEYRPTYIDKISMKQGDDDPYKDKPSPEDTDKDTEIDITNPDGDCEFAHTPATLEEAFAIAYKILDDKEKQEAGLVKEPSSEEQRSTITPQNPDIIQTPPSKDMDFDKIRAPNFKKSYARDWRTREYAETSRTEAENFLYSKGLTASSRDWNLFNDRTFTHFERKGKSGNQKWSAKWTLSRDGRSKGFTLYNWVEQSYETLWPEKEEHIAYQKIMTKAEYDARVEEIKDRVAKREEKERLAEEQSQLIVADIKMLRDQNVLILAPKSKIDSGYLLKKNVEGRETYILQKNHKVGPYYLNKGSLIIPFVDYLREIRGGQVICCNGKKFYMNSTSGHFVRVIGDRENGPILICEGYATGESALKYLGGSRVYIGMDGGNMTKLANTLWHEDSTVKENAANIIICGDNDATGAKRALETADAIETSQSIRPIIAFPSDNYNDFNDQANGIKMDTPFNGYQAVLDYIQKRINYESNALSEELIKSLKEQKFYKT
jgi:hypothetical protein